MTTVSIAMATYNGAGFIREQLESFAKQTVLPTELVVTDDQSTDGTLAIVAEFATTATFPVRVEKNEKKLGYRANFMKAAGLCRSDLIAFSDQDDVWLPKKLEKCIAAFTGDDVLLVYHNATVSNEALEPTGTMEMRAAPQAVNPPLSLDPWHFALGFTEVIRRDLLRFEELWPLSSDFQNFDNPEAHDQWFFFLASCLGTIGYLKEPLVLYRRHTQALTKLGKKGGARGLLLNLLHTSIKRTRSFELCARGRASVMAKLSERLDGNQASLALSAITLYEKLAQFFHRRWQIYAGKNFMIRFWRFGILMADGSYSRKNNASAGSKAALRDMFCVVLPPDDFENASS